MFNLHAREWVEQKRVKWSYVYRTLNIDAP